MMSNRSVLAAASLALAAVSPGAQAQSFPTKPIHIVIPYQAGGATDLTMRLIQTKLGPLLGQPVIVENRPGAGGLTGTEVVAKTAPDGYTMLANFDSFAAVPFLYSRVNHDPVRDFAPISLLIRAPQVFVVNPGVGLKNLEEFVSLAKRKGSDLALSTAGPGSSSRLTMELFKSIAKVDFTLVSYKGGGPAMNAVMGAHVAGFMASIGTAFVNVKNGKLVAIAVSSARRSPMLPGVPTLGETFPGFEAESWIGLVVPAATPRPVIMRLNDAVVKAITSPEVREKLESQGMEVVATTPEAYGEWLRVQVQKWGPIIQSLRLKLD